MRLFLWLAIYAALSLASHLCAQEYTVTATGTTGTGNGVYSNFPNSTPFSLTFQFNLATAIVDSSAPNGPTVGTYVDPAGSATFQSGTISLSGSAPMIQVYSGTDGYSNAVDYGYALIETLPNNYSFELLLQGTDPSVAPTPGLSSIQTEPLSDFGTQGTFSDGAGVEAPGTEGDLIASVTTFNVSVTAAPEPRAIWLIFLGFTAFWGLRQIHRKFA